MAYRVAPSLCLAALLGVFLLNVAISSWSSSRVPELIGVARAGEESGPRRFASAEAAANALIQAAARGERSALVALFGSEHADLVGDDDDPGPRERRARFVTAARQHWEIRDGGAGRKWLVVGLDEEAWTLPLPIVLRARRWVFDASEGKQEIKSRIIEENEGEALYICSLYARAQAEYAARDRDGDGVREYAQRLVSSKGKRDGLYWPSKPDEEQSPFGPLVAPEHAALATQQNSAPWRGYYWRVLTEQGPSAPGGRFSYLVKGDMRRGFALIGYPARYGDTGIATFLVGTDGRIHYRDLGKRTAASVRAIKRYNPSAGWRRLSD